jgi:PBP1b-binding outer membrane lipoprotein LpoB
MRYLYLTAILFLSACSSHEEKPEENEQTPQERTQQEEPKEEILEESVIEEEPEVSIIQNLPRDERNNDPEVDELLRTIERAKIYRKFNKLLVVDCKL